MSLQKLIDLGKFATVPQSIACRVCGFPMLARSKDALALSYSEHLKYGCRTADETREKASA